MCAFVIIYAYSKLHKNKEHNKVLSFHLLYYGIIKIVVQRNLSIGHTSVKESFKGSAQLYLQTDALMYPSKPNTALASRE